MIENFTEHAANERTFLAWVRTAVAIVGFGIVAARIGAVPGNNWANVLILGAGALVVLLAYMRMRVVRNRINSPRRADDEAGPADLLLVLMIVAFFGLFASFAIRLSL